MNETPVLLVEFDSTQRRRIGEWLEAEGFDVLACPGPSGPDYTCLAGRGQTCPLANAVGIVVLDLRLESDELMQGTPGWQVLMYYVSAGKKVVAISDQVDSFRPRPDEQVSVLPRPPERASLIAAIRELSERPVRAAVASQEPLLRL